ncbi:hypothetical protein F8388_011151 [Cannabis sativa]|uniref:Uncharacterized protein n=1 Tax=Cannabis sativa TaxID=3483 RepID=A0A7J6E6B8_CANSA|nr:hypothetical protein F8388_011151 [Cannabis sativa]
MGMEDVVEDGLLQGESCDLYTGDGSTDIKGNSVLKQNTGNWKACIFILGTECCERLAYFGISTNLVTYFTHKLHQENVSAARNVTIWQGTCYFTPLIGAIVADSYWGRYWTITSFSIIYFIGMCALTLSASVPALGPAQYAVLLFGLYLVAFGTGGIKSCVSPFGADQFDDTDSKERIKKGSFFNWFYFAIYIGILVSTTFLVWIQDNAGWGLGFGIAALFMGIALVGFVSGTHLYRFQKPVGSPFTRMCQTLVASCRKWNLEMPEDSTLLYEIHDRSSAAEGSLKLEHTDTLHIGSMKVVVGTIRPLTKTPLILPKVGGFLCLDKAAVISDAERSSGDLTNPWTLCSVSQVEEFKTMIHLIPLLATGIVFSSVYAQISTTFVEQGMMMDTTVYSFTIPPASLYTFDVIAVLSLLPIYDRVIVPIVRKFTGEEKGFNELQRMGIGLFISVLCMSAAAVLETFRLQLAKDLDLVHEKEAVPLSILWQIPQYLFMGTAEIFTYIGQLQFFYEQAPDSLRSLCCALALFSLSLGYYLSSFLLTIVTYFTTKDGKSGWIPDNLNEGHLDYFFWLLGALSLLNALVFTFLAIKFKQKKTRNGNFRRTKLTLGKSNSSSSGAEFCEGLSFFGISSNLVTYFTKELHQGNAAAAKAVSAWQGTTYLTPFIGAIVADAYFGKYWTIAVFSTIYFIGLCALTLSASLPGPSSFFFIFGLYLVALGTGGIKPCVSPFGGDQFDNTDSKERSKKRSFFNWFYFTMSIGIFIATTFLAWIQDNVGWGLGFGIPTMCMGIAIACFLFGTPFYRFQKPNGSPITRMCQVLVASCRNRNLEMPKDKNLLFESQENNSDMEGSCIKLKRTNTLKFLDKAAVMSSGDEISTSGKSFNPWRLCSVNQVEELKSFIGLLPIWACGIIFFVDAAQVSTMMLEQGMVMDTTIGSLTIPPVSLATFDVVVILLVIPIYDRVIVPFVKRFTGNEKGFTELQRIGIGHFIMVLSMSAAAVVEIYRLYLGKELGLVHQKISVPLSILWQIPQYVLVGIGKVFTSIGLIELFYEESPIGMRSLSSALLLLNISLGFYLNSFIVTMVTYFSTKGGKVGWIPDNLNEGHLDYFFWVLAALSFFNFLVYIIFAMKFAKNKKSAYY